MNIADVRLVDGSEDLNSTTTEYASLPLTVFFKDAAELTSFKTHWQDAVAIHVRDRQQQGWRSQRCHHEKPILVAGSRWLQCSRYG